MSKLSNTLRRGEERANREFLSFFKFPVGKVDFRILPAGPGADQDDWYLEVGQHYGVLPKAPVYCPVDTEGGDGGPCAVCEMTAQFYRDDLRDEAKRISVKRRIFVRALIRGEEEKGAQLLNLPLSVFMEIGKVIDDEETYGTVLSIGPKGRDFRIIRTGTSIQTKYAVQALPHTKPLLATKSECDNLIASLTPITQLVTVPSSSEVAEISETAFGFSANASFGASPEEPDDDEDTAPATDDGWDENEDVLAETDDEEEVESDEWLDDAVDTEEDLPDISAMAARDQANATNKLEEELSKVAAVRKRKKA